MANQESQEKDKAAGNKNDKAAEQKKETEDVAQVVPPPSDSEDTSQAAQEEDGDGGIKSTSRGGKQKISKIEVVMNKLEKRREQRMEVTRQVRKKFLEICKHQVQECGEHQLNVISFHDLVQLQERFKDEPGVSQVFQLAVESCVDVKADRFYFRDFNEYQLALKKSFIERNPMLGSLVGVLAFYFASTVLFCGIMRDESLCPRGIQEGVPGWATTIYFISTTISTVGYGDVNVTQSGSEPWRVFIITGFMIIAMVIAFTIFSQLAASTVELTQGYTSPYIAGLFKRLKNIADTKPLWYQLRTVAFIRLFELSLYFVLLNLCGTFVARIIFATGSEDVDWNWMTTFYWSVQTTTTIGYGDLDMPYSLRWFNIFYTVVGTAFAASLLGNLADLKNEIQNIRRFYIWKNREVSMRLIEDMNGDGDGHLDAYEFLIGSLITLEKIQKDDVRVIMQKFQDLAGDDGYISESDVENHNIGRRIDQPRINRQDIEAFNARMYPKSEKDDVWKEVELVSSQ